MEEALQQQQHRRLDWLLPSWLENVDAYSQSTDENMIDVLYTVVINASVFLVAVSFYVIYRRKNTTIYCPKVAINPERNIPKLSTDSYFGWVQELWGYDDLFLVEKGSFDILFFIRFYRLCFKILACSSIYCWIVLIPINGTGGDNRTDIWSFDRWSMTNVAQESTRCWFHLVGIYLVSAITIYFLEKEFIVYAKYRHVFLRQTHAHLRTVLVEGIPHKMRSPATLYAYFDAMYPGAVAHVRLAQNLKYLDRLVEQRTEVLAELERCLYAEYHGDIRPVVRVGNMLNKIDAIRYYSQLLDDLNMAVEKQQKLARKIGTPPTAALGGSDSNIIKEFLKVTEIKSSSGKTASVMSQRSSSISENRISMRRESSESSRRSSIDAAGNRGGTNPMQSIPEEGQAAAAAKEEEEDYSGLSPYQQASGGAATEHKASGNRQEVISTAAAAAAPERDESKMSQHQLLLDACADDNKKINVLSIYDDDVDTDSDDGDEGGLLSPTANLDSSSSHRRTNDTKSAADSRRRIGGEGGDDSYQRSEVDAEAYGRHVNSHYYVGSQKMAWSEWFQHMWTSRSISDFWRSCREGRWAERRSYDRPGPGRNGGYLDEDDEYGDDGEHGGGDDYDGVGDDGRGDSDRVRLISSYEERRLFLSKAFVTFRTFAAATTARQVIHMQMAGRMSISEAPEPTDVTWANLYGSRKSATIRYIVIEMAVLLLIVVWVAPVTLLSYIFSEDALRDIDWIESGYKNSSLFAAAIGMIQPLVLVLIMNCLPPVLTILARLQGVTSFSSNQFVSFNRYFTFQIVNVFLVTVIGGSVMNVISEISQDPASAFELLGSSLPKMAGFFTNYIFVKAFLGLGVELLRVAACLQSVLKTLFSKNVTPRDFKSTPFGGAFRNFEVPGWFNYMKIYAQDMLIFVVCATYACISPLIMVGGLLYFSMASVVYKHNLLYVWEHIYETGGRWWPKMARCIVVALLFAQATMVGMMILKATYTEIYYLSVLIVLTSFYYYYVSSIYGPLAGQLPLDMALAMDRDQERHRMYVDDDENDNFASTEEKLHGADDYLQPSLRAVPAYPDVAFPLDEKRRPVPPSTGQEV